MNTTSTTAPPLVFATLSNRPVRVVGAPYNGGWHPVDLNDSSVASQVLTFRFSIEDSGGTGFLLICSSADQGGMYFADTWHESLEDAFDAVREEFGIERSAWQETEKQGAPW